MIAFVQYPCQYLVCISDGLFQYVGPIWTVYLLAFIQFTWQYLVCIYAALIQYTLQYLVSLSDDIKLVNLAVFGVYFWCHLFSMPGSIWSVFEMAFIQYPEQYLLLYFWWHLFSVPSIICSVYLRHLFSIPVSIWSVYLMAFTQYIWQYLVFISVYLAVFGLYTWWHLFSIPGSIWFVYLMAFIQYTWQYLVYISDGIY